MGLIDKYWNVFWREQNKKNQNNKPKYSIFTGPESEEEKFMQSWIDKWHKSFSYFENTGCGCCYNSYKIDAPEVAIDELREHDLEVEKYEEDHYPIRTGIPSSFSEFNQKVESLKHDK